jgi:hypothetical protein
VVFKENTDTGATLMVCILLYAENAHSIYMFASGSTNWVIENHKSVTKGIIVCSYLFVCSFAVTMGPVSWTYPAEIFPMRARSKAVSLSTAVRSILYALTGKELVLKNL